MSHVVRHFPIDAGLLCPDEEALLSLLLILNNLTQHLLTAIINMSNLDFNIFLDDEVDDGDSRGHVDFLRAIAVERFLGPPLDCLLSYLDPADLARASCVSRDWNIVISTHKRSRERREEYLKNVSELKSTVGEVSISNEFDLCNLFISFFQENWPLKEQNQFINPLVRQPFMPRTAQTPVASRVSGRQQSDNARASPTEVIEDDIFKEDAVDVENHQVVRTKKRKSADYRTPHISRQMQVTSISQHGDIRDRLKTLSLSAYKQTPSILQDAKKGKNNSYRSSVIGSAGSRRNLKRL